MATKADLLEQALELGLDANDKMTKAELQSLIDQSESNPKFIKHIVTEEDLEKNPDLNAEVGDEIEIPNPDYVEQKSNDNSVDEKIIAVFERHPHVLTIWVDDAGWYFYEKPGTRAIERNEVLTGE